MAAQVVDTWKKVVASEATCGSPGSQARSGQDSIARSSSGKSSKDFQEPETPNSSKFSGKGTSGGANGKEEKKFDFGKIPKAGDITRDKFRELVATGLLMVRDELAEEHQGIASSETVMKVCVEVENELWSFFGGDKKDKVQ